VGRAASPRCPASSAVREWAGGRGAAAGSAGGSARGWPAGAGSAAGRRRVGAGVGRGRGSAAGARPAAAARGRRGGTAARGGAASDPGGAPQPVRRRLSSSGLRSACDSANFQRFSDEQSPRLTALCAPPASLRPDSPFSPSGRFLPWPWVPRASAPPHARLGRGAGGRRGLALGAGRRGRRAGRGLGGRGAAGAAAAGRRGGRRGRRRRPPALTTAARSRSTATAQAHDLLGKAGARHGARRRFRALRLVDHHPRRAGGVRLAGTKPMNEGPYVVGARVVVREGIDLARPFPFLPGEGHSRGIAASLAVSRPGPGRPSNMVRSEASDLGLE